MLDQTFNYKGNSVPYSDNGTGPAVLFLHGFGEDHTCWNSYEKQLHQQYRIILLDIPGTGTTPLDTSINSIAALADFVASLIDYLKIDTICIIGHSMGGYIAVAFAAQYPSRLSGLGLMHSSAYPDSAEKKQIRSKSIEFIQKNGTLAFFKQAVPNLFSPTFQSEHPAIIADCIRTAATTPQNSVIRYTRMMQERPGHIDVLKTIQVPVLFIIGKLDQAVSYKDSLAQCYLPTISHVDILPNVAHMSMWEEGPHTIKTISAFLGITTLYSPD